MDQNNETKRTNIWLIIGVIAAIAAVIATITTLVLVNEKKRRDDEELERYLDCAIQ